ncbi:endopeptidase La [Pectinatus brassicae]|uniref:Lon protease n=1 Tax=Pectinatus brassicae TaxID=862415 RepID=A0A840US90_9FIRM|nr:endopeptidase La [Pectinatus brassicae]MBB5335833.1 ATP-dependent Lon protease [Pectinatus brassicae]
MAKEEKRKKLPLLALRGIVVFPYVIVNLDVGRDKSVAALEEAMVHEHKIMLSAQKDAAVNDPGVDDIYEVGTVAEIRQLLKLPGGSMRVLVEGMYRAQITDINFGEKYNEAEIIEYKEDKQDDSINMEALTRGVVSQFEKWVKLSKKIPPETLVSVVMIEDGGHLCDLIASHMNMKLEDKQDLLSLIDITKRLEKLYAILTREMEILGIEQQISQRVHKQMEKIQKEYYLREQLKAIHKELGDRDGQRPEVDEYKIRMTKGKYPSRVMEVLAKEVARLERMSPASAETGVARSYIECLLDLPWNRTSKEKLNIDAARDIMEKDHYGLKKVKERILEYLAVRKLSNGKKAPVICLVGPPGVGKTSLASSIARAMGRKFVRASLGGLRDEAEIRGHRRTYVGSMPGRIINGIKTAESKNPVFLLDEIDKIAADFRGDPAAALLEVLDPEQNNTFSDHYVEIPFDLSQVFWIVTANNIARVPRPLRDRMEIITLESYTEEEKYQIAKQYLVNKQMEAAGLKKAQLQFMAGSLQKIIADYTRESGVRELERQIGAVCRKIAKKIIEEEKDKIRITAKNLEEFLGRAKYARNKAEKKAEVGVCTGLAWTEVGGDILPTEVTVLKGKGHLILTGQLGDVMQESAKAGLSYIRSRSEELGLDEQFYEKKDIHIHLPEGAIPKDGPSAGITMATAMISALTDKKVRSDLAMTGEITLRGRVLPIGGLKEKTLAAYREKIYTIILPQENEKDIEDIDEEVREKMTFIPVASMDEVLKYALVDE